MGLAGLEGQEGKEGQGAITGIQELLEAIEKRTNDIISMIEDLRFIENECNSQKFELSTRQKKFDAGELSGDVFKHIREKSRKDSEAFEKERQESWQSMLNSFLEISRMLDELKNAYSKRSQESGTGSIEQGQ